MIKIVVYIAVIILMMMSCSSKQTTAVKKENTSEEKVYKKTVYINKEYKITNQTLEDDVKLLTSDDLSLYKTFFEEELYNSLKEIGFELVSSKSESNYQLVIGKFFLKEFKLQVDGPSVNVALGQIELDFITPKEKIKLIEEVNKENLQDFDEAIFQDLVNELAMKTVKKIERKIK